MFQNLSRLIAALVSGLTAGGGQAAAQLDTAVRQRAKYFVALLLVAVLTPAVLFLVGLVVGGVGQWQDIDSAVTAAKFILALGAFLGALLSTLLWVKAMWYAHLIGLATRGAAHVKENLPTVEVEQIERFLRWARGWTAWFTAACIYAAVVPIWHNPILSLIVGAAMLGLSAVMTAEWTKGPWARRICTGGMVAVFVYATFALFAPNLARRAGTWLAPTLESDTTTVRQEEQLLRQFRDRRNAIKQGGIDNCRGEFCSEGDRVEYAQLGEKISQLRDGTYWDRQLQSVATKRPANRTAPIAAPRPVASPMPSGSALLAPPPPPPADFPMTTASVASRLPPPSSDGVGTAPRERGPSGLPRLTSEELDRLFAPLHRTRR